MIKDKFFINYSMQPGLKLNNNQISCTSVKPQISIITSYFNAHNYMDQTINCVLNQTFPYWEWIIVDDGSTNKESIDYLEKIKKRDDRIKIFHKENGGLAKGRDYAIKKSTTNLIVPLDADDLIEPTYLEIQYWALKTNPEATWSFSDSIGFGKYQYLSDRLFDSDVMKTDNQITATALIKKEKIIELGGYGVAKRYVNEDWHLWLRMLANNYFPVQTTFYGFWYRRNEISLLSQINDDKKEENKLRLRDLKIEADKIQNRIFSKVCSQKSADFENLEYCKLEYKEFIKDEAEGILYIIPELGFNKKFIKEIQKKSKSKKVYVIVMESSKKSKYVNRQNVEQYATVYDLVTFLDGKYFLSFTEYVQEIKNVCEIFIASNLKCIEQIKKHIKDYEIFNFKNSQLSYIWAIIKYRIINSIFYRAIRKIHRKITIKERIDKK